MKEYIINSNDANQRIDKFITKAVPNLPQSMMYKAIRNKRIKINGKRCEISTRIFIGDRVEMYINDEFFMEIPEDMPFLAASSTLDIIYEDDNIMLINKPAGLLVHEDEGERVDTLINRVLKYLHENGKYNFSTEHSFTPSLCNRIDRNTGGIVIAAKNATALRIINQKIKDREIDKYYLCIVHGVPEKKEALLKAFHIKDSDTNTVEILKAPRADSKTVLTKYKVLKSTDRYSLLEVELLTGRTHQIRAHLSYIGHPLLGDTKYGLNKYNRNTGFKHQALYSYKLGFNFTTDSEELEYLKGKVFEVKDISFVNDFLADKIK